MSELKDRDIVLPGQMLGERIRCEGQCITEAGKSYSLVRGLARVDRDNVNVIPLNGAYMPKTGDVVIGVVDADMGGVYSVDINGPYRCILKPMRMGGGGGRGGPRGRDRGPRRDEDEITDFKLGDLMSAKIAYVDEVKEAKLMGPRKLEGGCVISVKPMRVPRIIGKQKSMINTIRQYTQANIAVGQNGLIWISGGNMNLAVDALKKVEAEAPMSGLTDRMTEFLRIKSRSTYSTQGGAV
jgi:exosome complex component RRP4